MRKWIVIGALVLAAFVVWAIVTQGTRISQIIVGPGGDFTITVDSPLNGGTAVIHTDGVHNFHLTTDADAAGHRIANVAAGSVGGDAIVYGQAVNNGEIIGAYPNLQITRPVLHSSVALPTGPLGAGTCQEVQQIVDGAMPAMVAAVSPHDSLEPGVVLEGRVIDVDLVGVRVCALANATLGPTLAIITVIE